MNNAARDTDTAIAILGSGSYVRRLLARESRYQHHPILISQVELSQVPSDELAIMQHIARPVFS